MKSKLTNFLIKNRELVAILFIALLVRLIGVYHSFPEILHPDEPTVVRSALGVRFFINPKHFDWPHLYIYLNYFVYMGFSALRVGLDVLNLSDVFPLLWNDEIIFYLLTRILTVAFGTATCYMVYKFAREVFSHHIGIVAALILALNPLHVWNSQYTMPDIPMLFFFTTSLYFASRLLRNFSYRNFILAGMFCGLAASTKYNGAFSALYIVLIFVVRLLPSRHFSMANVFKLVSAGLASAFGFLLGTPFALLDFDTFTRTDGPKGALWQFTNVGSVTFSEQITKFFTYFTGELASDFGYTVMYAYVLMFLIYIMCVFLRRPLVGSKRLLLLYLVSLFLFFYIAGFEKSRSHYYLIVYPFVVTLAAYFYSGIVSLFKAHKEYLSVKLFTLLFFLFPIAMVTINTLNRYDVFKQRTDIAVEESVGEDETN